MRKLSKWCVSSSFSRPGFSLRELLVACVLLVTALLLGLVYTQRALTQENRRSVINNLRQVAIAVHNVNDTYRRLPPATGSFGSIKFSAPFSIHLLPFVDNDPLYKDITKEGKITATQGQAVITAFQASSDPTIGDGRNTQNFASNIRIFTIDGNGAPLGKDVVFKSGYGNAALPRTFTDGTSNVIMLATRYAHNEMKPPGATVACSPYDAPWDDSAKMGSPFFGRLSALVPAEEKADKTPTFQLAPKIPDVDCTRANFAHAYSNAGLIVGLGDASVRTINPNITVKTWNQAVCPNDGNVLGNDF